MKPSRRHSIWIGLASATFATSLVFEEWTVVLGSERFTGALLDRLAHHVHILSMSGESYRLAHSTARRRPSAKAAPTEAAADEQMVSDTGDLLPAGHQGYQQQL